MLSENIENKRKENKTDMNENNKRFGAVVISTLVSHGPSSLNRDDLGEQKTCYFGGTLRSRISSQCLKRAWRLSDLFTKYFNERASRTRIIPDIIANQLKAEGYSDEEAGYVRDLLAHELYGSTDTKKWTVGFVSDSEINAFINDIMDVLSGYNGDFAKFKADYPMPVKKDNKGGKKGKKAKNGKKDDSAEASENADETAVSTETDDNKPVVTKKLLKKHKVPLTLDQSFWGRMSTNDTFESIEGAMSVTHAISTNKCGGDGSNDFDYFIAADDKDTTGGAGHIGERSFTSNCYYECAILDLDQLYANLEGREDRDEIMRNVVSHITEIIMLVAPSGGQNTYLSRSVPEAVYVYHTMNKATAVTQVNAFASAISGNDITKSSVKALSEYVDNTNRRFFAPENQVWLVSSDRYEEIAPKSEKVNVVESVSEMGSAIDNWFAQSN